MSLIRGLSQRGYEREQVMELLRLIDWFVALPLEQERLVQQELEHIEEEESMAYVTSWERMGMERGVQKGLLDGQRLLLRRMVLTRFGAVPEALDQRLDAADQTALDRLADRISTVDSLAELGTE